MSKSLISRNRGSKPYENAKYYTNCMKYKVIFNADVRNYLINHFNGCEGRFIRRSSRGTSRPTWKDLLCIGEKFFGFIV